MAEHFISCAGFPLRSPRVLKVYGELEKFALNKRRCVLLGPSGVGKEYAARYYHTVIEQSRDGGPPRKFLSLNCAELSAQLLQSELFGHERGAFTGAVAAKPGLFELAEDHVLFLDEVGDLSPEVQPALLRALDLEHGEARRVGGTRPYATTNVHVICATERDPSSIRPSLLARLGHQVLLPGLDQRPEDIPEATSYFIRQALNKYHDLDAVLELCKPSPSADLASEVEQTRVLYDLADRLRDLLLPLISERIWSSHFRGLRIAIDGAVVCADLGSNRRDYCVSVRNHFVERADLVCKRPVPGGGGGAAPPPRSVPLTLEQEALRDRLTGMLPNTADREPETEILSRFLTTRGRTWFGRGELDLLLEHLVSVRTLQQHLADLQEEGVVEKTGRGSNTRYRLKTSKVLTKEDVAWPALKPYRAFRTEPDEALAREAGQKLDTLTRSRGALYLKGPDQAYLSALASALAFLAFPAADVFAVEVGADTWSDFLRRLGQDLEVREQVQAVPLEDLPPAQRIALYAGYLHDAVAEAPDPMLILLNGSDRWRTQEDWQELVDMLRLWPFVRVLLYGKKMPAFLAGMATEC